MKYFFMILILTSFNKTSYAINLFETTFYDIEFISNNIEQDKIYKINEIKEKSLLNILKKTLSKNNYNEVLPYFSDDFINTFIKNVIIDNEIIINDKYASKIKINFDKKKLIKFFREKKISYVEYYPKKLLLIIYEEDNINDYLFTKNNKFYFHLLNVTQNNNLFEIPNLDINDRFLLNKDNIKNRNFDKINKFSNKYNSDEVIIVLVNTKTDKVIYDLIFYYNQKFIEKRLQFDKYDFQKFFEILEIETLEIWKEINQVQNKNLNKINCSINYFNMLELKEIRNNLDNISIIDELNIKSLSLKSINYEIYYFGNIKIFSNLLKINNLDISKLNNQNLCEIKLK